VLLLDEPLGALDLKLRRQMQVELKRIQTEVGLTFIHVTHDQEEAMTMADTVAVMNHGRIEQMGPPAQMYDLPRTAFVANFVGQSNLGSGRVIDRDGTHLVAEIQGTKVKIPIARSAVTDGDITFGVRPEKVRVMRRPPRVPATTSRAPCSTCRSPGSPPSTSSAAERRGVERLRAEPRRRADRPASG
jgi:spermidine/putrescine transport system ATP-binding protein